MKLCVGAVSRRVVEEAAKLQVHQIVASRRQVDIGGGYTGLDQKELVELVSELSDDKTDVVRDHGGPGQGAQYDDGTDSLDADVEAGFDGLHLDVCKLPSGVQETALRTLVRRYRYSANIEIGGEHDSQEWNERLREASGIEPNYLVIGFNSFVWADRQIGRPLPPDEVKKISERYGFRTKIHNADWLGYRKQYGDAVGAYNIAPEFARVEIDALLTVLPFGTARSLLTRAYASEKWGRWFNTDEGTWDERARCALRYIINDVNMPGITSDMEEYVRSSIRDALIRG